MNILILKITKLILYRSYLHVILLKYTGKNALFERARSIEKLKQKITVLIWFREYYKYQKLTSKMGGSEKNQAYQI